MIIIDAFNMIYRAAYVACSKPESQYLYKSLHKTFLQIYFKMFNKIFKEHKREKIIIAWDAPGDSFRKKIFPGYKENRGGSIKDRVEEAFPDVKDGVRKYGSIILQMENEEADDIINAVCKAFPDEKITIFSGDKDFIQLINENVKLFNPLKKQYVPKPDYDYVTARAIEGDKSDNIDGLMGFGPKKAVAVLNNYDTFWASRSESQKELISRNIEIIDLNRNPNKDNIIEYVKKEIENNKNEYSFDEIRKFTMKHKLVEIFGNLKSELGDFL